MGVETDAWREVIGVVQSVKDDSLAAEARASSTFRFHGAGHRQPDVSVPAIAYVIRSDRAATATFLTEVRNAIWSVSSAAPVAAAAGAGVDECRYRSGVRSD